MQCACLGPCRTISATAAASFAGAGGGGLTHPYFGIIPPVIFYFFVQRYLARGLSFGAVKG